MCLPEIFTTVTTRLCVFSIRVVISERVIWMFFVKYTAKLVFQKFLSFYYKTTIKSLQKFTSFCFGILRVFNLQKATFFW